MSDLLIASPRSSFEFAGTTPTIAEARGGLNICGLPCNPNKYQVLREAFASQGLIRRMVEEPAKAASRIEVFPQFDHQSEGLTRAVSTNSDAERIAWLVFRAIAGENGNQRRLVQQIHKVQHGYGHGFGLTLENPQTRQKYLKFVPFHTVKALRYKGRDMYEWVEKEGKPAVRLEERQVKYLPVPDDLGYSGDAFSVFAPMVDTIVTWTIVWSALSSAARSSLFSAGLLWAPVEQGEKSWVDSWLPVIDAVSKQIDRNPSTITKIFPHPVSSGGGKPEHVEFGESISKNIMAFEGICREMLASMLTTAPMKQIMEGEGAGSQWASTLLLRETLNGYGKPQLEDVVAPALIEWKFHAMLEEMFRRNNISMDVKRWSIGTDILKAAIRPEDPAGALNTYKGLGTTREWVIEQQGGTAADLLPLPDGVDDYEHWRLANAAGRNNSAAFDPNTDPEEQVGNGNPPSDTENMFSPNERGPNRPTPTDQASIDYDPWMKPLWEAA